MASRMNGKRRKLTAEFKTKVVLEALKEKMTLAELSQKYEVMLMLLLAQKMTMRIKLKQRHNGYIPKLVNCKWRMIF